MTLEFYKDKITDFIQKKYQGNVEDFKQENPNLDTFLRNAKLDTVATHFKKNEEIYQKIITSLNTKTYEDNIQNTIINTNTPKTQEKPKVRTKKRGNGDKISGFVDALIIAFITGSFIGIILLNIYSKIVQHL